MRSILCLKIALALAMVVAADVAHAQQHYGYDPNVSYGRSDNEGDEWANESPPVRNNNNNVIRQNVYNDAPAAQGRSANTTPSTMPRDLQLTIAVGGAIAPQFMGADDYEAVFVPSVDLEYHNAFLVVNRTAMMKPYEGLGYKFLSNDNWNIGLSVLLDQGRDDNSKHIRRIGDIDPTALAGGFVSYEQGPVFARAQLHADVLNEYNGYRGELGLGVKGELKQDLLGMLETTARYGSQNHNREYFSVTGNQSAANGALPAFKSDSGFYQWGLGGVLQYNVTPGIFVQGVARYDRMLGDAADSPISKANNQYFMGTNVGYKF